MPESQTRVLFVSTSYPWPLDNGAILRTFALVRLLAARYHVTLVALRRGGDRGIEPSPLHELCERVLIVDNGETLDRPGGPFGLWRPVRQQVKDILVPGVPVAVRRWWSDALVGTLRKLRETDDYDVVWAERPAQAEAARLAGWSNVIVDLPDLDSEALGRALDRQGWYASRPLHQLDWNRLRAYEAALPERFSHVVVCKGDDRAFLDNQPNVSVVPNGVTAHDPCDAALAHVNEMLFVGTMGYEPNADALKYFVSDVMPKLLVEEPTAYVSVVGKEAGRGIQQLDDGRTCFLRGRVSDLSGHYESAAVVIAPIRLGSGTRLKILEALMFGKAVVATSMAIEGLDLRPGIDVEVADTPERFARTCVSLMRDANRRVQLGWQGRLRALEKYEWERIGPLAESVVENVTAGLFAPNHRAAVAVPSV